MHQAFSNRRSSQTIVALSFQHGQEQINRFRQPIGEGWKRSRSWSRILGSCRWIGLWPVSVDVHRLIQSACSGELDRRRPRVSSCLLWPSFILMGMSGCSNFKAFWYLVTAVLDSFVNVTLVHCTACALQIYHVGHYGCHHYCSMVVLFFTGRLSCNYCSV